MTTHREQASHTARLAKVAAVPDADLRIGAYAALNEVLALLSERD